MVKEKSQATTPESIGFLKKLMQKRPNKKPRVCFIYYARFINNAVLYREARAMSLKGFDVDVLCLRVGDDEKVRETINSLNVYKIQQRKFAEKSTLSYIIHLAIFFAKATLFLSTIGVWKRYDIIHVTSPPDIMVFTAIIPKIFGSKVILDIHDIGPELYMRKLNIGDDRIIIRLLRYFERISSAFADHVMTVTDLWKETLTRSVEPSKCTVLLNVPDDEMFKPDMEKKKQKSDYFNLFYHGTIDEHFGVDTMLQAMPLIKSSIPNVRLNIYGNGRLRDEMTELADYLGIRDYVRFHDFVTFFELPGILSGADMGIVPTKGSVFSNEALSMKSLEYLSLGIPVVISRTKAHSYYFSENVVKFYQTENHEDLAKSVIEVLRNPEERNRLIAGSDVFMKEHGWPVYRERYYEVVNRLLTESNGGAKRQCSKMDA